MIEPMYPNPACWWNQRTLWRHARVFHRDKAGDCLLEIQTEDASADRIAGLIASGLLTNQATPELNLRLMNAVAGAHSGNAEEGQRIVSAILAELSS